MRPGVQLGERGNGLYVRDGRRRVRRPEGQRPVGGGRGAAPAPRRRMRPGLAGRAVFLVRRPGRSTTQRGGVGRAAGRPTSSAGVPAVLRTPP
jgi:hypothetical protein